MTGQNRRIFWTLASGMLVLSLVTTMAGLSPAWADSRRHRSHSESLRPHIEQRHVQRQPLCSIGMACRNVPTGMATITTTTALATWALTSLGTPTTIAPTTIAPTTMAPTTVMAHTRMNFTLLASIGTFPPSACRGFHYPGAIGKGEEGFQAASPPERSKSHELVIPLDPQRGQQQ